MPTLNPPLNKDDFLNSRWQEVVNSSKRKDCCTYSLAFWNKAKEAEAVGNVREQAVLEILAVVSGVEIKPEATEEFFAEVFKNLTDEHLNFLADIAADISDPELQARVADILWIKRHKKKFPMAQLAVDAYLQSVKTLEDPERWNCSFKRIERAFRLALTIRDQVKEKEVVAQIEAILDYYQGEDPLWLSIKLMKLLLESRQGEPAKYAALAEKAANIAEAAYDWQRARACWEIKAKWHLLEKDSEKEREASMLAAETYIKEAEEALTNQSLGYSTASALLQKAIEAFRRVRGTKEETVLAKARAEEVHRLLIEYQEKSVQELVPFYSDEVDVSESIQTARNVVKNKEFQDAIFALALLGALPQVSHLREEVQEIARDCMLYSSIAMVTMNEMGKVVAHRGSILSDNSTEAEEAIRSEMYRNAIFYQNVHAQTYIEPARMQVNLEHSVRVSDLLPIVENSPFVPSGREYLFAKGLYAGLIGDFFTSTHILIPQIENSVRDLLWKRGVITSGLDDKGIQNEHNLNTTLYRTETESIFDEDTLFNLKGLLVEHSGSNLRNRMAHGLINDNGFINPLMSYLWWITLRLCCLPILNYQQKIEQSDPWVKFSGMFKDDPLFDEFVEDMSNYRRELDPKVTNDKMASGEN